MQHIRSAPDARVHDAKDTSMASSTGPTIRSFGQISSNLHRDEPVITLFSGGLDSSYLLLALRERGFTDVHALSVGIGASESVAEQRATAETLGAKFHSLDRCDDFVAKFVAPAIRANAVYLDLHPVSSTLSRPLIAATAVELAMMLGSRAILHTANRSQNTLRRLNGSLRDIGFAGEFGSPYDLDPVDRQEKLALLAAVGVTFASDRSLSGDSNLWCREFESGYLDNPESHRAPFDIYEWSRLTAGPEDEDTVTVGFESGLPVAIDGTRMPLRDIIDHLNQRAGRFGLGRYTGLEHLDHGEKVIEVREMPGAALILRTARHLEAACISAEALRTKLTIEQIWVREALEGRWFGELRRATNAFLASATEAVTGSVTWSLTPGIAATTSIVAREPLYLRDREAWEAAAIRAEKATYAVAAGQGVPA